MRIYGGHDYYDCGLSMGIDPSIVLVRGNRTVTDVRLPFASLRLRPIRRTMKIPPAIDSVTVVFCWKVYRGVIFRGVPYWNAEKLREVVSKEKDFALDVDYYVRPKSKRDYVARYFDVGTTDCFLQQYMTKHKIAIMVKGPLSYDDARYEHEVQVNPANLKTLGFAKALDPYTAFHELSMWIGGVLGGTSPEIVSITDDLVLAQSHGFDKESFRGPRIK